MKPEKKSTKKTAAPKTSRAAKSPPQETKPKKARKSPPKPAGKPSPKPPPTAAPAPIQPSPKQPPSANAPSKGPAPAQTLTKKTPSPTSLSPSPSAPAKPKAKPVPQLPLRPTTIPPILLEGDAPSAAIPDVSGPGSRYALGPVPPGAHLPSESADRELPEAYGTRQLILAARDPHWLYASWDLTAEQRRQYNRLSADGHLILRTFTQTAAGSPQGEIHVHPESRNWFIHVDRAGTRYVAQLGYRDAQGRWHAIATSKATVTPPDALAEEEKIEFATIPAEVRFDQIVEIIQATAVENIPLIEAIQQLRAEGHPQLPAITTAPPQEWTPAQTAALEKIVAIDHVRRVWMGSLEITELIRRQLPILPQELAISSAGAAQFSAARPAGIPGSLSSAGISIFPPALQPGDKKGFWFNINAELIVYGSTDPAAAVTIAGKPVALRPDGSFSFRFSLPDGAYELPAAAVSPDKSETRQATLRFSRDSEYRGGVEPHPQDSQLRTPPAPRPK